MVGVIMGENEVIDPGNTRQFGDLLDPVDVPHILFLPATINEYRLFVGCDNQCGGSPLYVDEIDVQPSRCDREGNEQDNHGNREPTYEKNH
jgi:hypothetical protein